MEHELAFLSWLPRLAPWINHGSVQIHGLRRPMDANTIVKIVILQGGLTDLCFRQEYFFFMFTAKSLGGERTYTQKFSCYNHRGSLPLRALC